MLGQTLLLSTEKVYAPHITKVNWYRSGKHYNAYLIYDIISLEVFFFRQGEDKQQLSFCFDHSIQGSLFYFSIVISKDVPKHLQIRQTYCHI